MSVIEVHAQLGNGVVLYYLALAIWGLVRFARRQGVNEGYWWGVVVAETLVMAQGGLGIYLWYSGIRPAQGAHVVYGFVSGLVIPAVYVYTRGREERTEMLAYAVTALVMVGLIVGAVTTAS